MELISNDELTLDIIESGCVTWEDLVRSVRNFKYGRGEHRGDFEGVWYQRLGTCSTKHGFLHLIAELNGFNSVQLVVGMYLMTAENTPMASKFLDNYSLEGIPEAHCYLKIGNDYLDVTTNRSDFSKIADDILEEREVNRSFLISDKIVYHRNFMESWAKQHASSFSMEELWKIREEIIGAMSEN